MKLFLGIAILVGVFGGLFAVIVRSMGWREAFEIYGLTAGIVAVLGLASWLISSG